MTKKLYQFVPLGIAMLLVVIHLIEVFFLNQNSDTTNYSMVDNVMYGAIGLVIILMLIFFKVNYWKYAFLGLIFLSFFGIVGFSNRSVSISINFITIELIALMLLIFHLVLSPEILSSLNIILRPSRAVLEKKENLKKDHFESSVSRFEKSFKSKSKNDLECIVNENILVPEAIEAAKRLLSRQ